MSFRSAAPALVAALLFGASTPLAKLLVGDTSPLMLAGMLYLGSGIGLGLARLIRDREWRPAGLSRKEWPWLPGSILFGGVLGPTALMFGLTSTSGSTASLLLNLKAVLTASIARVVFKENAGRCVVLGMLAIIAGRVILSWPSERTGDSTWIGTDRHAHAPGELLTEPHAHAHRHGVLTHKHPHYPDIHHRHGP